MPGPGDDHYRTLGVPVTASDQEVRAAYRALAARTHPDRATNQTERRRAETRMAAVNEAWRVLSDSERRAAYDLARRPAEPPFRTPPDDGPIPGRRGDSFQAVTVSPAVGCALRFGPMVLAVGLLVGILIATAVLGGGGEVPKRLEPGSCLELSTTVRVVPCTAETPVIAARGVAGTSCPIGTVAVVLPSRTEQVCVAPPGTPVG